jgi:hypothetical protein
MGEFGGIWGNGELRELGEIGKLGELGEFPHWGEFHQWGGFPNLMRDSRFKIQDSILNLEA